MHHADACSETCHACRSDAFWGHPSPRSTLLLYSIIPHFGPVADLRLTPQNSSKFAQSFFLNKYIDKDFYQIISESNAAA
jgi:hypothetical protein